MKCWKVRGIFDDDGICEVVFADTANDARSRCAHRDSFHDVGYTNLRAGRFKKYDGREDDPPSMSELVRNDGWWTNCHGCHGIIGGGYNANGSHSDLQSQLGGEEAGRCYCGLCWPLKVAGTLIDDGEGTGGEDE